MKIEFVKIFLKRVLLFLVIQTHATIWFYIGKYDLNQLWGGLSLILITIPIAFILIWIKFDED